MHLFRQPPVRAALTLLVTLAVVGLSVLALTSEARAQTIIYVKSDAPGSGDGTSWNDAFAHLNDALAIAVAGDQVWVAVGTYHPDQGSGQTDNDRAATFQLPVGVAIYGGFEGNETPDFDLADRDFDSFETILSGDINGSGNLDGNSYSVVTGSDTSDSTILDGFTITAGNADGSSGSQRNGGGLFNQDGSPRLTNLNIVGNRADGSGGGMRNVASSPSLSNITFSGNNAVTGGGMANANSSSPSLGNVTLSNNMASTIGGGMHNNSSSAPTLNNVTFSNNTAGNGGGGMLNSTDSVPTLINTLIAGNMASSFTDISGSVNSASRHNLIGVGTGLSGISDGTNGNLIGDGIDPIDPLIGALSDNGGFGQTHPLLPDSPAIGAGSNDDCLERDQRGLTRPQGEQCDIGAFEFEIIEDKIFSDRFSADKD